MTGSLGQVTGRESGRLGVFGNSRKNEGFGGHLTGDHQTFIFPARFAGH